MASAAANSNSAKSSDQTNDEILMNEEENGNKARPNKHDSGAHDLQRVTDYVEETEMACSAANVDSLAHNAAVTAAKPTVIRKDDVELIMRELCVPKAVADRRLREHHGDVTAAIKHILVWK